MFDFLVVGFRFDDMNAKLNTHFAKLTSKNQQNNIDGQIEQMTDQLSGLSRVNIHFFLLFCAVMEFFSR